MKKETLIEKVSFITNPDSSKEMQMYGFKKGDNTPYKINVDTSLREGIISVISYGIKTLLIDNEKEYEIVDYSTADERKNRYYEYDLPDIPDNLKSMSDVIGDAHCDNYDFSHDGFGKLDHFIIVFSDGNGHPFSVYKSLSTIEKLTKSKKSILGIMGKDFLEGFEGQLLRIGPSFQVVFASGKYILLDDKFAETTFGLLKILKNQATKNMNNLKSKDLVYDYKKLEKYMDNIAFSRKLVKVLSKSKIINESVSKVDILNFISNDDKLKEILKTKERSGDKYIEITNKTNAQAFLDLLNDEFVFSQLTKQKYQAIDKEER